MTLTPPLLLDGNTIVIDSTSLECFKLCPTKFYREQVQRRMRAGARPALDFGKALHAALEVRYKQAGNHAVIEGTAHAMHTALDAAYAGVDTPLEEWRTLARAHEVVDLYNQEWGVEPWEVLGVEVPFATELGNVGPYKVVWQGRLDLLLWWEGQIYVGDHKTMQQWSKGKTSEYDNSAQFKGYAWAMQEMHRLHGAPFPPLVAGFLLNALVTRKPYSERALKTASKAGIDSNEAFMEAARGVSELDAYLGKRKGLPRNEFHRNRVFYSQERLTEWRVDALAWVRTLLDYAERGYWPMNTRHCSNYYGGACPMLDVCTAPIAQRKMVLASDMFCDNTWSPLDREKEAV